MMMLSVGVPLGLFLLFHITVELLDILFQCSVRVLVSIDGPT